MPLRRITKIGHPLRENMRLITASSWRFDNVVVERVAENPGPQPSADTEIVDSLGGMKLVEDTPDVAVWHIGNLYFRVLCNRDDSSSYDAEHANGKTLTCIPESSYSFGVSKLLHAHQSRGRTYMIHCPPTGKPLEAMWPTLSNTLRDRYDEEVTAATKEFAQNTGLRDFLPHLEGDPESEVYELTVEEKLKVDRRIALGQQLVREHLQDTWAARELVCILPQASIECGRGPAENLEFGDVAVVPEGVVVTAHGIGVTSFQIVGMSPMGSERVVRTVVCPMAYNNGSCEGLPPLQHSRGVLKKRRAHNTPIIGYEGSASEAPEMDAKPRRTWLTQSNPLAGYDDWVTNPASALTSIIR